MTTFQDTQDMREKLQKGLEPDLYANIARFFSIHITKVFLKFSITANQVSLLFCIASVIACIFLYFVFITKNPLYFLLMMLFLWLYIILDCVDGEIARHQKSVDPIKGKVIDVIGHEIFDNAVIIAVALGIYSIDKSPWVLFICLILFFGKNTTRRLEDIIIRTLRIHSTKTNLEAIRKRAIAPKFKDTKKEINRNLSSKIKYCISGIPYKGTHLCGLLGLLGNKEILLGVFALWALSFNIKFIHNLIKFLKSPMTYLPD